MTNTTPTVNVNIGAPDQPAPTPYPWTGPQPEHHATHATLNTKRSLTKYILLGIITFGIYDLWQMTEISTTINLIATRRDGKRTMNYLLLFFLIGWITFGIGYFVWGHRISERIGVEQAARRLPVTVTASTYWLWNVLGAFILIGPFIYTYKLLHAMNDICADYNVRG